MAAVIPSRLKATVSPGDRLSFTVFLAAALHAALILGVTFTYVNSKPSTHTMEVTLAQQRAKQRPENADFLAQFNQVGSGALEEKAILYANYKFWAIARGYQPMAQHRLTRNLTQRGLQLDKGRRNVQGLKLNPIWPPSSGP